MQLQLVVWRRGLDPAAETCTVALRDLLRFDVTAVERAELWSFDVGPLAEAEVPVVRQRLRDAACRAGRYVNLNRDGCEWVAGARPPDPATPRGGCAVDIWVRDGEGRDAVALAWFRAQGFAALRGLQRGVLWRLYLPTSDPVAARDLALEIAVTRARRHGLLANPQSQTAEILHVVPVVAPREGRP